MARAQGPDWLVPETTHSRFRHLHNHPDIEQGCNRHLPGSQFRLRQALGMRLSPALEIRPPSPWTQGGPSRPEKPLPHPQEPPQQPRGSA
jgi:hypothetical protein